MTLQKYDMYDSLKPSILKCRMVPNGFDCCTVRHLTFFLSFLAASNTDPNAKHRCPYCPNVFSQKGNLRVHLRTHTNERPFTCQFCSFSARQRINLVTHLRTHTCEKPYKCDYCNFRTAQVANLRSHVLKKHQTTDNLMTEVIFKVSMLKCNYCSFLSRKRSGMLEHCRASHPGILANG